MSKTLFKRILGFALLCLAQALVLNRIHLFSFATPLLYVYMVLLFRRNYPHWGVLIWCFFMGLVVDSFSNTPGLATASMTFLGFIQPSLLKLFVPRDAPEDLQPSMKTLGVASFSYYTVILVALYMLLFYTLEAFNFFNWQQWLATVFGSMALTIVLILAIENVRRH